MTRGDMGAWIAGLRKRLGLTQARLAEAVGASKGNVARWESGENVPSGRYVLALQALDTGQPGPAASTGPAIWPLVIADMAGRDALGRKRYGVPLQPHNGRDALRDAYEEALDLAAYLRQAIHERDGK